MEIGNVEIWKTFRNLEKKLKFQKNLENYNFLEICKNFGNQENIQIFGNSEKDIENLGKISKNVGNQEKFGKVGKN